MQGAGCRAVLARDDRGRPELEHDLPQRLVPGGVLLPVGPLRLREQRHELVEAHVAEREEPRGRGGPGEAADGELRARRHRRLDAERHLNATTTT